MTTIIRHIWSTFAPLRNQNLKLYTTARAVSMVGTWMQTTAQAWLVWELSHSAVSLGIVGGMAMLPFLFLAPWTGVWADRLNRKTLLFATQASTMLLAFVLALLVQTHAVQIWHVYLLALLLGCVTALDLPTHHTFLGDLSGIGDVRNAILINNIVFQLSRLLGPTIAGLLIGWVGMAPVFWLNGLSYLAVIWALTQVSTKQTPSVHRDKPFHEFIESLRFIRNHPKVQYLFAFSILVSFLAFSSLQMLAAYASDILHGGSAILGLLMGASGLGAFLGSLVVAPLVYRAPKIGVALAVACSWTGGCFFWLACSESLSLSLAAIAVGSLAMPAVTTATSGLIQVLAAEGMRARLASAWLMIFFGVQPLATFLVGYYAHYVGVAIAIGLNGALMIVGSLVLTLGSSELRKWVNPPMTIQPPTIPA